MPTALPELTMRPEAMSQPAPVAAKGQQPMSQEGSNGVDGDLPAAVASVRPEFESPAPGNSVRCARCRTPNPPERTFCSHCGANLREACFACGALNHMVEAFCGACGANLRQQASEATSRCEKMLTSVRQAQAEGFYELAIDRILPLTKEKHPRLAPYVQEAQKLLREVVVERQRASLVAEAAAREGVELMAQRQWTALKDRVRRVPEAVRTDVLREMLQKAQAALDERTFIERELADVVKRKAIDELIPLLDRLLQLFPDHPQAEKLTDQIRKRALAAAKEPFAQHRYDEALQHLSVFPESMQNEGMRNALARLRELAALAWDLKRHPIADKALLRVAARLAKLAPENPLAKTAGEELRRRLSHPTTAPGACVPWAAVPQKPTIGVRLVWPHVPPSFELDAELDTEVLAANPGCHIAACGLALLPLGQAEIELDLMPEDQRGLLGRMSRLMSMRIGPARSAWGIDVGTAGLKAAYVTVEGNDQPPVIGDLRHVPFRKPLGDATTDEEVSHILVDSFKALSEDGGFKGERVCLGVPNRTIVSRLLRVPYSPGKEEALIQHEVQVQVPFAIEELTMDYQVLDEGEEPEESEDEEAVLPRRLQTVLMVALRKSQIQPLLTAATTAGLTIAMAQPVCLGAHNALAWQPADSDNGEPRPVQPLAVLDLGASSSTLVSRSARGLWIRALGASGQGFTRALIKQLQLTYVQAEKRKRDFEEINRIGQVAEAWDPMFRDLADELRLALDSIDAESEEPSAGALHVIGGATRTHGLLRFLLHGR